MASYLIPVLLAILVGFLTQRTGLCMVRGVQELIARRPSFLFAILCSGFWYWCLHPFSDQPLVIPDQQRFDGSWHFLVGGLLFGLGAALNKGCSISTISKLARGHFYMLATVVGWVIGWSLLASFDFNFDYQSLAATNDPNYPIFLTLLALLAIMLWRVKAKHRPVLLGVLLFGISASLLTLFVPDWSPSQLIQDISVNLTQPAASWPALQRYLIIAGLIFGMAYGAKKRLRLSDYEFRGRQISVHLFAGIIMGIGASMALGGNDSQLLVSMPSFSPAAGIAVLFMIIGIATGLAVRKQLRVLQPGR